MVIDETDDTIKDIRNLERRSTYTNQVDGKGVNKYKVQITKGTPDLALGSNTLKNRYNELLRGKIDDNRLRETLMINSEQLLKNRITMRVVLSDTKSGISGIIKVIGVLPEWENQVRDYFIDKTISSNDWFITLDGFKRYMDELGKPIVSVYNEIQPSETITVGQITAITTFQ